jgi:hypothetical protein
MRSTQTTAKALTTTITMRSSTIVMPQQLPTARSDEEFENLVLYEVMIKHKHVAKK